MLPCKICCRFIFERLQYAFIFSIITAFIRQLECLALARTFQPIRQLFSGDPAWSRTRLKGDCVTSALPFRPWVKKSLDDPGRAGNHKWRLS
jgi:hypothetical protein